MNEVTKVEKVLQQVTTLKAPKKVMKVGELREFISNSEQGKKAIAELKEMGIDGEWLRTHGFVIAFMLLDFGGEDERCRKKSTN